MAGAAPAPMAAADTFHLLGVGGGRVEKSTFDGICRGACRPSISGFLAIPEPGYRFAGWQGACETTIGPLCTLPTASGGTIGARFEVNPAPSESAAAVLLMTAGKAGEHDRSAQLERQFGGHCPAVFGGVILGSAPDPSASSLRCYRLEFGYFEALDDGRSAAGADSSLDQLALEIRAAVLALQARHPDLRLVLAGQGRSRTAVLRFMRTGGDQRHGIQGLIDIMARGNQPNVSGQPGISPLGLRYIRTGDGALADSARKLLEML